MAQNIVCLVYVWDRSALKLQVQEQMKVQEVIIHSLVVIILIIRVSITRDKLRHVAKQWETSFLIVDKTGIRQSIKSQHQCTSTSSCTSSMSVSDRHKNKKLS